jgi:phosphatidylserine/phosphatidylglycerophosphate/cardiolipin synthase-like enzyme
MKLLLNFITSEQQNFKFFRRTIFILLLLSSGVVLVNILKPSPKVKLVQPLPQDPAVQVYFNQNPASSYEDPYRHFTRKGDNLEQQIIDAINQARSTVDLAVMEFRLPKVAEALTVAYKRGVKVRVLIDNKYNKTLNIHKKKLHG